VRTFIGVLACCLAASATYAAPPPEVSAKSVVVMDAWSGQVLMEKDAHTPRAIASVTKVMTAMVILDRCPLDQMVIVSKEAAETGESSCLLKEGEQLSVHDLLEMALMRSGNDAAVALAVHAAGSVPAFASMMNQKAAELGLKASHFTNPHGLDEEGHHQCAMDVALLCHRAMQNETFSRIVAQRERMMQRPAFPEGYKVVNTNQLLRTRNDCIGIKTGWTGQAGYCLAAAAQRGARRFIVVVLNSERRFEETGLLLDWAFDTYVERVVVAGGLPIGDAGIERGAADSVPVAAAETLVVVDSIDRIMPEVQFRQTVFRAPIEAGQEIGYLEFEVGGEHMAVPAVATRSVNRSFLATLFDWPNAILLLGCLGSGMLMVGAVCSTAAQAAQARGSAKTRTYPSHRRSAG
jgi:D-alanyl-D-alanine carboxypeptidase (penicillin-binding protein 5/6)